MDLLLMKSHCKTSVSEWNAIEVKALQSDRRKISNPIISDARVMLRKNISSTPDQGKLDAQLQYMKNYINRNPIQIDAKAVKGYLHASPHITQDGNLRRVKPNCDYPVAELRNQSNGNSKNIRLENSFETPTTNRTSKDKMVSFEDECEQCTMLRRHSIDNENQSPGKEAGIKKVDDIKPCFTSFSKTNRNHIVSVEGHKYVIVTGKEFNSMNEKHITQSRDFNVARYNSNPVDLNNTNQLGYLHFDKNMKPNEEWDIRCVKQGFGAKRIQNGRHQKTNDLITKQIYRRPKIDDENNIENNRIKHESAVYKVQLNVTELKRRVDHQDDEEKEPQCHMEANDLSTLIDEMTEKPKMKKNSIIFCNSPTRTIKFGEAN